MSDVKQQLDAVVAAAALSELEGKKFWLSKTFWVNTVSLLALLAQLQLGFVVGVEYQAIALTLVNLALRKITRQPVIW